MGYRVVFMLKYKNKRISIIFFLFLGIIEINNLNVKRVSIFYIVCGFDFGF